LLADLARDSWAEAHPMKEKRPQLNLLNALAQLVFGRLEFIA
jgi:hypothetical protein